MTTETADPVKIARIARIRLESTESGCQGTSWQTSLECLFDTCQIIYQSEQNVLCKMNGETSDALPLLHEVVKAEVGTNADIYCEFCL